jgi:polyisoprenoid-binding protein YceI
MATTKWALDPAHSEVSFKIRHLLISNVSGHFKNFTATVETESEDFATAKVNFSAEISSLSTNNEQRDGHLKAADFFDAENHPQLTFTGSGLEKVDDENYKLHGTLNMKGVSQPVTFNVEHGGVMKDPWGNDRTGFTVSGKVHRKDFGVQMPSEAPGMLGEDVTITANAEFVKEKAMQPA